MHPPSHLQYGQGWPEGNAVGGGWGSEANYDQLSHFMTNSKWRAERAPQNT